MQAVVEHGEHFAGRAGMGDHVLAQNADGQRAEQSRGGAFAGDVAEDHGEAALPVRKKIVEVAAEFACRFVGGGEFEARDFTSAGGEKLALNFARGGEVGVKAALGFAGVFVEAGIFQGNGDVGTQGDEHALVLGGEGVGVGAFQVEHADQAILEDQRHDQLGAGVKADVALNIARVLEGVVDSEDPALAGGGAGESLMQRKTQARGNGVAITQGEGTFQVLGLFVPEHDTENVVVNELFDALGDAAEQLFAVEDRGDFPADFVEQSEGVGLLGERGEQTGRDGIGIANPD
jgi:hypothetical protein